MKRMLSRRVQRGASFFGVLIVLVVLALLGVVAMQAAPTYLEYQAVQKAVNKAREGTTVAEARSIFDKAAQVDDIKSISGKDLEVTKENDRMVVRFAYNREIHLFGPAHLLLKYAGQSK